MSISMGEIRESGVPASRLGTALARAMLWAALAARGGDRDAMVRLRRGLREAMEEREDLWLTREAPEILGQLRALARAPPGMDDVGTTQGAEMEREAARQWTEAMADLEGLAGDESERMASGVDWSGAVGSEVDLDGVDGVERQVGEAVEGVEGVLQRLERLAKTRTVNDHESRKAAFAAFTEAQTRRERGALELVDGVPGLAHPAEVPRVVAVHCDYWLDSICRRVQNGDLSWACVAAAASRHVDGATLPSDAADEAAKDGHAKRTRAASEVDQAIQWASNAASLPLGTAVRVTASKCASAATASAAAAAVRALAVARENVLLRQSKATALAERAVARISKAKTRLVEAVQHTSTALWLTLSTSAADEVQCAMHLIEGPTRAQRLFAALARAAESAPDAERRVAEAEERVRAVQKERDDALNQVREARAEQRKAELRAKAAEKARDDAESRIREAKNDLRRAEQRAKTAEEANARLHKWATSVRELANTIIDEAPSQLAAVASPETQEQAAAAAAASIASAGVRAAPAPLSETATAPGWESMVASTWTDLGSLATSESLKPRFSSDAPKFTNVQPHESSFKFGAQPPPPPSSNPTNPIPPTSTTTTTSTKPPATSTSFNPTNDTPPTLAATSRLGQRPPATASSSAWSEMDDDLPVQSSSSAHETRQTLAPSPVDPNFKKSDRKPRRDRKSTEKPPTTSSGGATTSQKSSGGATTSQKSFGGSSPQKTSSNSLPTSSPQKPPSQRDSSRRTPSKKPSSSVTEKKEASPGTSSSTNAPPPSSSASKPRRSRGPRGPRGSGSGAQQPPKTDSAPKTDSSTPKKDSSAPPPKPANRPDSSSQRRRRKGRAGGGGQSTPSESKN